MSRRHFALLLTLLAIPVLSYAFNSVKGEIDPECQTTLPVTKISAAAGKKVELTPYDPMKAAGGHCNYTSEGKLLLIISKFSGGARQFKSLSSADAAVAPKPLKGVGDEAVLKGSIYAPDYIVIARRGNSVVAVSSALSPFGDKALLAPEVLAAVANAAF